MNFQVMAVTDPEYGPFSRRIGWIATAPSGYPVGSAFLRLDNRSTRSHLAQLELAVHPGNRRQGVGTRLLGEAVAAAGEQSVRHVVVDTEGRLTGGDPHPGELFLQARDFEHGLSLVFAELRLDEATAPYLPSPTGYRLEWWRGVAPERWIESFSTARSGMDDAPTGKLPTVPEVWDADRTRQAAETVERRGEHLLTVVAVHDQTGIVAGYSEVVVPADGKGAGQHYGTAVLPEHRGRGVARWLKTEQLRLTRKEFPDLEVLQTDTVSTNATIRALNAALGYRPTHQVDRYFFTT